MRTFADTWVNSPTFMSIISQFSSSTGINSCRVFAQEGFWELGFWSPIETFILVALD